jgi:membrane fusion protein (multidrug efflux system)
MSERADPNRADDQGGGHGLYGRRAYDRGPADGKGNGKGNGNGNGNGEARGGAHPDEKRDRPTPDEREKDGWSRRNGPDARQQDGVAGADKNDRRQEEGRDDDARGDQKDRPHEEKRDGQGERPRNDSRPDDQRPDDKNDRDDQNAPHDKNDRPQDHDASHDGQANDKKRPDHDGHANDKKQPDHDERPARKPESKPVPGRARALGIAFVVVVLLAALAAVLLLWRHHHRLRAESEQRAHEVDRGPRVFVTAVRLEPGTRELTLPADIRGFSQATVYAKVSGYVKSIVVDKGDTVQKGQILGVLESPEVDQQVAGAEADLLVKKRTFERYQQLVAKDFVSQQEFETARAQYDVAQATLKQMRAMQGYETLRAPFTGTVTARYVDPGALVPAATGSTQSALPLVDVADLRRLRILLFVEQDAAPYVHVGDPVKLSIDQRPDLKITAPITRFAQSLDTRSRTMLCEIWLDNPYHLYPGTFVHATLRLKTTSALPFVPSSALLVHQNKPALAIVRESKVHFVTVRPGLDDGHMVQIIEGVKPGDRVALDLPAEVADGAEVQPSEKPPEKAEEKAEDKTGGETGGGKPGETGGGKPGDEPDKKSGGGGKPDEGK